jgi:tRNA A-37 threonylcarbamoyl transferase component Bud32
MVVLLLVAPFLGLASAGGTGGYVGRLNTLVLENVRRVHLAGIGPMMRGSLVLGSAWTVGVLRWLVLLALVFYRRWQHLLAYLVSLLVVGWILSVTRVAPTVTAPQQAPITALVAGQLAPWVPIASFAATVISVAYGLATYGRARRVVLGVGAGLLVALGVAGIYLERASLTAVLTGTIIGVAVPLLAFRVLAPEASFPVSYHGGKAAHLDVAGERGQAIRTALREQLGMTASAIEPFGLEGSGGSTPLRIRVDGDTGASVFGKLYALTHLRSDRSYKLGRMILYGALEDEKPFNSVRRLAEYEDYMLRYIDSLGILSAKPYGFIELTPEREYLLVTEFLEGAKEILQTEVGRETVRQGLGIVRSMWNGGLAHRDVKPSNLLVRDGTVYLIDVAFAQIRPSPWRQAVDLANMMLVLALATSPELVYEEAEAFFTPDEIAEAFAATRGITIPSQLRAAIDKDDRNLVAAFRAMSPPHARIPIQRWTIRRAGLTVGLLVATFMAGSLVWSRLHGVGLR